MQEDTARKRLRRAVRQAGGLNRFALAHGLQAPNLSVALNGRRPIPDGALKVLGLERIEIIRPIKETTNGAT